MAGLRRGGVLPNTAAEGGSKAAEAVSAFRVCVVVSDLALPPGEGPVEPPSRGSEARLRAALQVRLEATAYDYND
jgi:hypothetical protein